LTDQNTSTNDSTVTNPGSDGTGEPSLSDVLARLDSLEQKTDGKFRDFGKDLGRLRERIKTPDANDAPAQNAPDMGQLRDMVRFEAVSTSLPEGVRTKLTQAVEGGMPYAAALDLAAALKPAPSSAKDDLPVPPGDGARPANSPSGMHPVKMSELIALRRDDKQRYDKLMADDTFDPSKLR
jgi:hypothetical protein